MVAGLQEVVWGRHELVWEEIKDCLSMRFQEITEVPLPQSSD